MALFINQAVVVPDATYKLCNMEEPCRLIELINDDPALTLEFSYDGTVKAGEVWHGDVHNLASPQGDYWQKVWVKMAVGGLYRVQGTPAR